MAQGGDQIRDATLAEQYRRGLTNLNDSGWQPDIVISHSGWAADCTSRNSGPTATTSLTSNGGLTLNPTSSGTTRQCRPETRTTTGNETVATQLRWR